MYRSCGKRYSLLAFGSPTEFSHASPVRSFVGSSVISPVVSSGGTSDISCVAASVFTGSGTSGFLRVKILFTFDSISNTMRSRNINNITKYTATPTSISTASDHTAIGMNSLTTYTAAPMMIPDIEHFHAPSNMRRNSNCFVLLIYTNPAAVTPSSATMDATAAPIEPKKGISARFNAIFATAPIMTVTVNIFCFPVGIKYCTPVTLLSPIKTVKQLNIGMSTAHFS